MFDEKSRYRNLSGPPWREMTVAERAVVIALWTFMAFFGCAILYSIGHFI